MTRDGGIGGDSPARAAGAPFAVTLEEVVREIPGARLVDEAAAKIVISGVHHDSRRVEPGDLFVARPGGRSDGAAFVNEAVAKGARAVLALPGAVDGACGVPLVTVDDVPRGLAFASAAVYGHPTFALDVVGITGTNGKTTTAHLVTHAIDAAGGRSGIVGTLGYRFGDFSLPATHTSPEADELARIAAAMLSRGATHLTMEVSSIALAAKRVEAIRFRVAAFTNLTQDHLDYHGTMEAYAEAKARLFTELSPGGSAINVDDAFGRTIAERVAHTSPGPGVLARYSASVGVSEARAEVAPISLSHTAKGLAMSVRTPSGRVEVRSPLLGLHNASNLLCALAIAHILELDVRKVAEALSGPVPVPGRLERCDEPSADDVVVLVDYAHTPDALSRVLGSVRGLSSGRVICVFGCGGDRDPGKRPLMGEAVARGADMAIVTNDNPRSEDPRAIADAVLLGFPPGLHVRVELDRREAIASAILDADPGDVVLVAGKGHEDYQIVGPVTHAFDDRVEARAALEKRRARKGRA